VASAAAAAAQSGQRTAVAPTCPATVGQAPVLVQRKHEVRRGLPELGADEPPRPLTVLCWNVMYKNFYNREKAHRRKLLADLMVNDMQADVAGLQECMDEGEMQSAFGNRMQKAPGTDQFNCIFFRPSVVDFGGVSGRRYLGDGARDDYSQRFVSYAKLFYRGREFWLFSTHWCLDGPCAGAAGGDRHRLSAQVILGLRKELGASSVPAIITADANSHMDGYDNDDGVQWLLGNGFEIAGKGPMAGGIDYIFVSTGDWEVGRHIVGATEPSDHPSFSVQLTMTGDQVAPGDGGAPSPPSAAGIASTPSAPSVENHYRRVSGVGSWGGTCTCPDGQTYNVGDLHDACAAGPASLACEGGTAGDCERRVDAARDGMKVTCAPGAASDAPSATSAPVPEERTTPSAPSEEAPRDNYRKAEAGTVGSFGGWCTCPSGERYNVGDRWDGCAKGRWSLACEGGTPGDCEQVESSERQGMMVTCAPAQEPPMQAPEGPATQPPEAPGQAPSAERPSPPAPAPVARPPASLDNYRWSPGVGEWGGLCVCPSGASYNVGDLHDGCAHGTASLACEGGTPMECIRQVDKARAGMKVTCAPIKLPAEGKVPEARPEPEAPTLVEVTTTTGLSDDYRRVDHVGAWGGICTCPSGKSYNVGDKRDGCQHGKASLACEGGVPGECHRVEDTARAGMMVTCG